MTGSTLTDLIHDAIAEGRLPNCPASSLSATYGDGTSCDACAAGLHYSAVVYVARFSSPKPLTLRMHYACFEHWERAVRPNATRQPTAHFREPGTRVSAPHSHFTVYSGGQAAEREAEKHAFG
jgi:hypothetical protein